MAFIGLDNMLGAVVSNTLSNSIKMINISELHESDDNFFIVENIESFAHTILGQGGVKDNLIVRPLDSGGYEIVSGHRRKAAVQYLIEHGENISHKLPCLVQEYADEEDKMLDLILMNVSSRRLSDSEMWKCYETIENIIKAKKEKGEYFGRIRDDIAKNLGISTAQVGKMQNVEKYAIDSVKDAVTNGDISISTANELAKLSEEEQKEIADSGLKDIKPKDIKKKAKVDTNINAENDSKSADVSKSVDTNINNDKVDTNINIESDSDSADVSKSVDININNITFRNKEHSDRFAEILEKMASNDSYHISAAYLIALDSITYQHNDEIFDYSTDKVEKTVLNADWQTNTSKKTTRLILNLFSGCSSDGMTYTDDYGDETELPSRFYSPNELFCCEYAKYYIEAIKIRFSL